MQKEHLNPSKLLSLSGAYWETCALHGAVKLDIFTAMGHKETTALDVAKKIHAEPRAVAMLLNALCAMELIKKKGEHYTQTPMSTTFLCKDSPQYVGFMIMHHHHLVESWSRLDEAVISGKAVRSSISHDDESRRESFLMGMFNLAMGMAPGLVPTLDLSGKTRFLDLGGGPGTYAIHFCMHNPNLMATVFDLPTTRPFAQKTIEKFNMSDRIDFQAGNFIETEIQGKYDVVWLSHILHGDSPSDCDLIVEKAAHTLEPGGMMIIHDFILDPAKDGPLFPALFSLNMLLGTQGGQSYSENEINAMMTRAGIENIRRTPYRGPMESGLMVGTKK
ncbi:Dimerisation domain-containing protein [Desulfocicer vacuolatum DSM 3385]|uniref:Dimerisation domain-containing protein n=1 Tax=Desulfocicer vacuolatum DSM 3385 TaxID=1121400 RepID=A0A1W2CBE1_9BACT|nr:methyltransferase [Desulfocicer vacuolatum]SMC82595.1 Dimerisation domain-containing protein [Desulfocicer vacuolatum DSM 3385]